MDARSCILTKSLKRFAVILGLLLAAACAGPDGPHRPPPPPVPAPWFYYWYYPWAGVYYDVNRYVYFYIVDGVWVQSTILPPHLRERLGEPVELKMRRDKPYELHEEHRKQYPALREKTPPPTRIPEKAKPRDPTSQPPPKPERREKEEEKDRPGMRR